MNFRNYTLFILVFLFCAQIGTAQQITTNENGEKIIVYPDGSWKYADDAEIEKMKEKGDEATNVIKPTGGDAVLKMAVELAELAAAEEAEAVRNEEDAKYERILLEDELEDAEESDDYFDDEIKEIKDRLKKAIKREKQAKTLRKTASKKAKNMAAIVLMGPEKRAKALKKLGLNKPIDNSIAIVKEEPVGMFPGELPEEQSEEKIKETYQIAEEESNREKKVFAKYDPSKDVYFNPPSYECKIAFDGVDEFSGKKRKDVAKDLFFTYTNEELRSIFRDRDYMTCIGYLSSLSGGLKFLTLNITIASQSAQREYGILEKGALINIKLLDGENVKLVNSKTNIGTENPLERSVTYKAQYLISSGDEKKLKKSEVDKVRIIWSSGYEDYEIFELDFFKNQFKCLDGK